MVIPDYRACFDFFRPHTTLIDWLEAHAEQRRQPTRAQVFGMTANQSMLFGDGRIMGAFSLDSDVRAVACNGDLDAAYVTWRTSTADNEYKDTHCSVMSPASFELLIRECRHLGLLTLDIDSFAGPNGCEFYVHLVNRAEAAEKPVPAAEFNSVRTELMHRIWNERATATIWGQHQMPPAKRRPKWLRSIERRTRRVYDRLVGGGKSNIKHSSH